MLRRLRVLIVDDEGAARRRIRDLVGTDGELEVVGEAENGPQAIEAVRSLTPDLVFLDVQMPGADGFQVAASLDAETMPAIIFVTAFDDHALKAFDAGALDYVLKPVVPDRFATAVSRAKDRLKQTSRAQLADSMRSLLSALAPAAQGTLGRLAVRQNGTTKFVGLNEIDWVESDDNYVRIHCGPRVDVMRETLQALEQRLPTTMFARVHRKHIVNLSRVREIQPWFNGEYLLILSDGTKLSTGRSYRDRVKGLIGN